MTARTAIPVLLAASLIAAPAIAANLQSDCRAPGFIGTASMASDGTITLNIQTPGAFGGALAYKRGDPNYARILAHVSGLAPGQKKSLPAFCEN